jgi:hypothetical protein
MTHAFLEIRSTTAPFRRVTLTPGTRISVGRTSLSDVIVADDDSMAQVQFEIAWDGERCALRDLEGNGAVLIGGEAQPEANLSSGAWVRGGRTDFFVYLEGPADPSQISWKHPAAFNACNDLYAIAATGKLFGVFDAAQSERIVDILRTQPDEYDSLFEGVKRETLSDVAPYIVHFKDRSQALMSLLSEGWGKAWGVYLEAPSSLIDLKKHFRKLLLVTRESTNEPMYFRFYDPRVMSRFAPILSERQRWLMFGDITRFLVEGQNFGPIESLHRGQDRDAQ